MAVCGADAPYVATATLRCVSSIGRSEEESTDLTCYVSTHLNSLSFFPPSSDCLIYSDLLKLWVRKVGSEIFTFWIAD